MEALSFGLFFQILFYTIIVGVIVGAWLNIIFGKD